MPGKLTARSVLSSKRKFESAGLYADKPSMTRCIEYLLQSNSDEGIDAVIQKLNGSFQAKDAFDLMQNASDSNFADHFWVVYALVHLSCENEGATPEVFARASNFLFEHAKQRLDTATTMHHTSYNVPSP